MPFLSPFTPPAWEYAEGVATDSSVCSKCNRHIIGSMSDHDFDAHRRRFAGSCILCYYSCSEAVFRRHLVERHPTIKTWEQFWTEYDRISQDDGDPDHHEDLHDHG